MENHQIDLVDKKKLSNAPVHTEKRSNRSIEEDWQKKTGSYIAGCYPGRFLRFVHYRDVSRSGELARGEVELSSRSPEPDTGLASYSSILARISVDDFVVDTRTNGRHQMNDR